MAPCSLCFGGVYYFHFQGSCTFFLQLRGYVVVCSGNSRMKWFFLLLRYIIGSICYHIMDHEEHIQDLSFPFYRNV